MFFGRENELADLSALWQKRTASLVTCRGRRHIGKSSLIEEFARRSKARFIELAGEAPHPKMTNDEQLANFYSQLRNQCHDCSASVPSDWFTAFCLLDEIIDDRKTVILLDEISWMGQYDTSFPGALKTAWDTRLKKHDNLILILCGSVSTWIQKNILNNTGFVGRASLNLTLKELPLRNCAQFWGDSVTRISSREILDVLSVTGGVPRYLEEINPAWSANENIRNLCFRPNSLLRDDFSRIFSSIFGENAVTKRKILTMLAVTPMSVTEIAEKLNSQRGGTISDHISELITAGFIAGSNGLNPLTGKTVKTVYYRITDNYTRFFLKYINPNTTVIDLDSFAFSSLEALPGWSSILGLQFENLVFNNLRAILPRLGLAHTLITSAAPWRQLPTTRKKGCQIDLLIQTPRSIHIVEIKRKNEIDKDVEDEITSKIKAISMPRDISVHTALIYDGHLAPAVESDGLFDTIIPIDELLL